LSSGESIIGLACQVNALIGEALKPTLVQHGLTNASFDLLSAVRASDGRETQAAIGKRLGLSRATVSEASVLLEKSGLVIRASSPTDQRSVLLSLTALGHKKVGAVLADMLRIESEVLSRLTTRESELTLRSLKKVLLGIKSTID
jgi:DNA-binding MarR family transcriptional regulator